MRETYQYDQIKEKYAGFQHPAARVTVNGKDFSEDGSGLVLSSLELELSTGFEASVARFSVFNVFDKEEGTYRFKKFKSYVLLGSSITIALGYSGQLTELFAGFIASVRFVSDEDMPHHVEVTAMDVKGLMMSGSSCRQLSADSYGKAVEEIFSRELYRKMRSEGIYTGIQITATPDSQGRDPANQGIGMVSESDYEFVVKAAKRFHYEFYVEKGVIYFRKAKAVTEDCLIALKSADGVLRYDICYDITGIVQKVEVRGTDTARGTLVSATASAGGRLSAGNKAKALITKTKRVILAANAVSKELAQYRADSVMEDLAYRYGSLQCECVGIPELLPGHFVRIANLGEPCGTRFYVTNVTHSMSDFRGYYTQITGKAAGL